MLQLKDIPLQSAPFMWFVAGGWALDLYLGKQTRYHSDIDLGIFRSEQLALQQFLSGWSFTKSVNGEVSEWRSGERLSLPIHEIHANSSSGGAVEFLIAEGSDSHWIYRRDPTIIMPISSAVLALKTGMRVLAPEIVLLFKSKNPREHDQADFESVRSHLSKRQAQWLLGAINRADKDHSWTAKLASQL